MKKHLLFILLIFWWFSWLLISNTRLNPIVPPSLEVQLIYYFSLTLVICSYVFYNYFIMRSELNTKVFIYLENKYIIRRIYLLLLLSILFVLFAMYISDAFSTSFKDYFLRVRGAEAESLVSGSSLIDYGLKIVFYPIVLSIILIVLPSPDNQRFSLIIFSCFIFILLFCYFFQVNYPMIFIFLALAISMFNPVIDRITLRKYRVKTIVILLFFGSIIMAAGFNRFGAVDLTGMLSHYIISYHTLGFSLFDYYYHKPDSLLHDHTFGLSILSTFDFVAAYFLKILGCNECYMDALSQNVYANSVNVNLGANGSVRYVNAFGTYLYTFYRDFNFVGIILYSVLYGITLAHLNAKSLTGNRYYFSLYIYAIVMGMIAMGVSPFDFKHFWFVILFIFLLKFKVVIKAGRR